MTFFNYLYLTKWNSFIYIIIKKIKNKDVYSVLQIFRKV
jgi:hypothetical protein